MSYILGTYDTEILSTKACALLTIVKITNIFADNKTSTKRVTHPKRTDYLLKISEIRCSLPTNNLRFDQR